MESWWSGYRDPVHASFWSRRRAVRNGVRVSRRDSFVLVSDGFCVGRVSIESLLRERSLKVNGFLADAHIATSPGALASLDQIHQH